jgi:putative ABC transport system ATP-binding protein
MMRAALRGSLEEGSAPPAARGVGLTKTYGSGTATVHALVGVSVAFERGRFTAVMGPSGSGKSTLLHCMAGLDRPSEGQVFIGGTDIGRLDDAALTRLRRDSLGFVFQSFNLVPTLSAAENITLPVDLAGRKVDRDWFGLLVTQLGLGDRLGHRPVEMSGGQQQRVACARALINRPELVFADEPTGNLDSTASTARLPPPLGGRVWPVGHHGDPRPRRGCLRRPGGLRRRRGHGRRARRADRQLRARADARTGSLR